MGSEMCIRDSVKGVAAGSNLEMPSCGYDSAREVIAAVRNGKLKEADLDERVGLPDSFSTEYRCLFFYCHLFNQFLLFHNCFPSHFHPYSTFFLFLYPLITSTSIPAMKSAITMSIPIPAFFQFSIPVSSCSPS